MNIGIFTNNYLPNPYGVTGSIETFRKEFEKRGHDVFIFAPFWKGYKEENKNVFRYPSIDINIKFRYPLPVPFSYRISKIINNLGLDIIHAQHPELLGSTAARWSKNKKIPLIFTWHTLYDQYTNFVPFIPEKIAAKYIIDKAVKFANKADAVIVPTDSVTPIIRNWGVKNENITAIATGVSESDFSNSNKNIIRDKYNIKEDEILLLIVSRLTGEKNIKFIFNSIKKVLKKNNLRILIVGDGYLRSELEIFCKKEGIEEKAIFCGEAKRKEMKSYYAASDIFIYGSKSETQGMIITEAMYMGLPIVAVNATGIKSLVLNNGNGFLVKEDEKEFEEAVEKLINDKDLRNKFSETSARIARMKFTASICAEKMLEVYRKAVENLRK